MTTPRNGCLARIQLDQTEIEWLSSRPMAAQEVPSELRCEFELGHSGPHAALGQRDVEQSWWIRWTLAASEVVDLEMCTAESDVGHDLDEREVCLLHEDHPGRHTFEFDSARA